MEIEKMNNFVILESAKTDEDYNIISVLDSYHLSSMNLNIDELEDLVLSNRKAI